MSLLSLYKRYAQSVKSKLIINVILIHAILMSFVVFDLITREHDFMQEQFYAKGHELTSLLASNASIPLLNNDLVALDELLSDVEKIRGHYMVFILDKHAVVRATTNNEYFNLQLNDKYSKMSIQELLDTNTNQYQIQHDNLVDTVSAVKVEGKIVGYVRTLLDESFMMQEMNIITKKGVLYVLLAIALGTYFAWLTVRRLTDRLNRMAEAAEKVTHKDFDVKLPLTGSNDELSKMMHAFNVMSKSISEYTKELTESERRLLEAQEISHIGSWELDLKTSKVQWSPEVYKIYEKDPSKYEPSLENDALTWTEEDQLAIEKAIKKAIDTGERTDLEHKILFDDGRVKYVYKAGLAEYDEEGNAVKIKGITQDITQHTVDTQNLKAKENQLLIQSRLAQMGEMISMIAHQWRQPLSAISATSMNLKVKMMLSPDNHVSTAQEKEEHIKELEDIETYVQGLSSTINDFRNFYKGDQKRVRISLDTIVDKALHIIKTSLNNDGIDIDYEANATDEIEILDGEVMQVILNVLKNSQDNFEEKKIENPKIEIKTSQNSIVICDNGGGIPEEIFDKVFDPYFSSKDQKNGTGLGLYMSKIIIEDHHKGSLEMKNTSDGVCCSIRLKK